MLSAIPTALYPFLFAIVAAIGGAVFGRLRSAAPFQLVSAMLYALAVACVIIGIATVYLDRA